MMTIPSIDFALNMNDLAPVLSNAGTVPVLPVAAGESNVLSTFAGESNAKSLFAGESNVLSTFAGESNAKSVFADTSDCKLVFANASNLLPASKAADVRSFAALVADNEVLGEALQSIVDDLDADVLTNGGIEKSSEDGRARAPREPQAQSASCTDGRVRAPREPQAQSASYTDGRARAPREPQGVALDARVVFPADTGIISEQHNQVPNTSSSAVIIPVVAVAPVVNEADPTDTVAPVVNEADPTISVAPVVSVVETTVTVAPVVDGVVPTVVVTPAVDDAVSTVVTVPAVGEVLQPIDNDVPAKEGSAISSTDGRARAPREPQADEIVTSTPKPTATVPVANEVITSTSAEVDPTVAVVPVVSEVKPTIVVAPVVDEAKPTVVVTPVVNEAVPTVAVTPVVDDAVPTVAVTPVVVDDAVPTVAVAPVVSEVVPTVTVVQVDDREVAEHVTATQVAVETAEPTVVASAVVETPNPAVAVPMSNETDRTPSAIIGRARAPRESLDGALDARVVFPADTGVISEQHNQVPITSSSAVITPVVAVVPIDDEAVPTATVAPVVDEAVPAVAVVPVADEAVPAVAIAPVVDEPAPAVAAAPAVNEAEPTITVAPVVDEQPVPTVVTVPAGGEVPHPIDNDVLPHAEIAKPSTDGRARAPREPRSAEIVTSTPKPAVTVPVPNETDTVSGSEIMPVTGGEEPRTTPNGSRGARALPDNAEIKQPSNTTPAANSTTVTLAPIDDEAVPAVAVAPVVDDQPAPTVAVAPVVSEVEPTVTVAPVVDDQPAPTVAVAPVIDEVALAVAIAPVVDEPVPTVAVAPVVDDVVPAVVTVPAVGEAFQAKGNDVPAHWESSISSTDGRARAPREPQSAEIVTSTPKMSVSVPVSHETDTLLGRSEVMPVSAGNEPSTPANGSRGARALPDNADIELPATSTSVEVAPAVAIVPSDDDDGVAEVSVVEEAVPQVIDASVAGRISPEPVDTIKPEAEIAVVPDGVARVADSRISAVTASDQFLAAANEVASAIYVSPGLKRGEAGEIRVVLQPDVLGGSEVVIAIEGKKLEVTFVPTVTQVADVIVSNQAELETQLAARISTYEISVAVAPTVATNVVAEVAPTVATNVAVEAAPTVATNVAVEAAPTVATNVAAEAAPTVATNVAAANVSTAVGAATTAQNATIRNRRTNGRA